MSVSWPRTLQLDATLLGEQFEVEAIDLGAVVHTPGRRDFHFGNALHLHAPPRDLDPVLAVWAEHLGHVEGLQRFVVVWEGPVDQQLPDPVAARIDELGLQLDRSDIMRLGELERPAGAPTGLAPRAAERDTDWACVGALLRWISDDGSPEFWRWMGATGFRAAAEAGHASAWLVHRHGEPACTVVLGHDQHGTGYIGAVATHPAHRRHGLATALTYHACQAHLQRHPAGTIELGAEPGGPAQRLYEGLGLRTVCGWWELTGDAAVVRNRAAGATGGGRGAG